MTIQMVCEQAAAGRGLWAGIFPDIGFVADHALSQYLPPNPHITLAHFGRDNSREKTIGIYKALCDAAITICGVVEPLQMEITGTGVFWRRQTATEVALVNSAQLFSLRSLFLLNLTMAGIDYDDRYGFIPHITLNGSPYFRNARPMQISSPPRTKLVCGEVSVFA